jgi:hypothetical protein
MAGIVHKEDKKKMKLYAGFVDGKLGTCNTSSDEGDWKAPEIFPFRTWAKVYYEDVREVEIVEVKK